MHVAVATSTAVMIFNAGWSAIETGGWQVCRADAVSVVMVYCHWGGGGLLSGGDIEREYRSRAVYSLYAGNHQRLFVAQGFSAAALGVACPCQWSPAAV